MRSSWIILAVTLCQAHGQRILNDYITHYEELNYDTGHIHRQHDRVRRSLDTHVSLNFQSHGRHFPLKLRQDRSTFSNNHHSIHDGKNTKHDVNCMYEGHIENQPGSRVHGAILNGRFAGVIHTNNETFYVDKEEYHFKEPQHFHSVIYSEKNIVDNPYKSHTCGHEDHNIHKKMEHESRSTQGQTLHYRTHNIYSRATNTNKQSIPNTKTCPLFLQTDTELWEHMKKTLRNPEDETIIKEEITAMLGTHVQAVRNIYEGTDFDGIRGITFTIRRTRINTTDDCTGNNAKDNPFCKKNIDVSMFLNLNSYQNHNDYCLAYIFTYRDFMGGTLGLAWVGSPTNMAGGICEQQKLVTEQTGERLKKSTNTGIVTLVNYGKTVVPQVSHITFAHEVGHNFGSPHDAKTARCQPYSMNNKDPKGNYIMFPSATSGNRVNNNLFSPCSIGNMSAVLVASMTEQSGKKNCFVTEATEFCGNGIQEGDEECDCGFYGDCDDDCCYPRDDPSAPNKRCKRTDNNQCSPSEGSCCSKQCTFKSHTNTTRNICAYSNECAKDSYCTGDNATCPTPDPKKDWTPCNDNTQVCRNGTCAGSICSMITKITGKEWEECSVVSDDKDEMCHLGCRPVGNGTCYSSSAKDIPDEYKQMLNYTSNNKPIVLQPGAACNNLEGYCDSLGKCRGVDAKGPLARLKEVLFNPATYDLMVKWITEQWWAVALMILGLILLMGGFIKVCSVHTPSSNPNKPKARKISETLRRRQHAHARNNHPPRQPEVRGRADPRDGGQGRRQGGGRPGPRPQTQAPTRIEQPRGRHPTPSAPPSYGDAIGHDNRYFHQYEMQSKRV